ncbi:MAG TPA: hypothetical protein VEG84_04735 [Thermoanaerobaculia bacterium]|nr:hypothetical protein [Thermoanaerobaculia bacterium]
MISFLTLFLGLMAGEHLVEASVTGPVAAVVMQLDGVEVARVESPPWKATVDFGKELAPHELVARALDSGGREIDTARQWVNLPRQPAEIEVLLERNAFGAASGMKLALASILGPQTVSVAVTFDGRPLTVGQDLHVDLPAYDNATTHLLSVTARFPSSLQSRKDLVLGGGASGEAKSALTALPVRWKSQEPPTAASLARVFARNGQPLVPAAVERGSVLLLIVRDLSADEARTRLGSGAKTLFDSKQFGAAPVYDPEAMRQQMRLDDDDRVRFIWPKAASVAAAKTELFENSHDFTAKDGGLHWLLTRVYHPAKGDTHIRYADAVAVAGLQAFQSYSRRAVLLVTGAKMNDSSLYDPATVRGYLRRINVPLYVWSLQEPGKHAPAAAWGDVEDISSADKLRSAFARMKEDFDSQWIVWFAGEYRPADIALAADARDVEIVR